MCQEVHCRLLCLHLRVSRGDEVIKYVLIPKGAEAHTLPAQILEDLTDYMYNDVNDALRASGYMSDAGQTANVYKLKISIKLEEVK